VREVEVAWSVEYAASWGLRAFSGGGSVEVYELRATTAVPFQMQVSRQGEEVEVAWSAGGGPQSHVQGGGEAAWRIVSTTQYKPHPNASESPARIEREGRLVSGDVVSSPGHSGVQVWKFEV
jgi:hypothetical protein